MFQESELLNLVAGLGSVPVIALLSRRVKIPCGRMLYAGFACLLLGYVATVVEGVALPQFLNRVEHSAYAAAGLCFLGFARPTRTRPGGGTEGP